MCQDMNLADMSGFEYEIDTNDGLDLDPLYKNRAFYEQMKQSCPRIQDVARINVSCLLFVS